MEVDHYSVLGLPSGKDGAELSREEIVTAYRRKCKELHPDKRPGNSNAHAEFLQLQESYLVLKDESRRTHFDDMLKKMNANNMAARGIKRRWQKGTSGFHGRESKRATRARKFDIIDEIRRAVFAGNNSYADVPLGNKGVQLFTRIEKFDIDDIRRAVLASKKSYGDIPLESKGVQVSCWEDDEEIRFEGFPLEGVWVKLG